MHYESNINIFFKENTFEITVNKYRLFCSGFKYVELKFPQILLLYNSFFSCPIILKFCTEHGSHTDVMGMSQQNYEFNKSVWCIIICITMTPGSQRIWLTLDHLQSRSYGMFIDEANIKWQFPYMTQHSQVTWYTLESLSSPHIDKTQSTVHDYL